MDERDLEAEHPTPRRLVDQLGAGVGEISESDADVVDLIRDVVHPWPALREEATDGSVLAERSEQLDTALADPQRCRLDPLVIDPLTVLERRAEQQGIRVDRVVEIVYGNSDVMDCARFHSGNRM